MKVPEGKTLYAGRKVFKAGKNIPPYLEEKAKNLFEKTDTKYNFPQEKKKSDFKKEDK